MALAAERARAATVAMAIRVTRAIRVKTAAKAVKDANDGAGHRRAFIALEYGTNQIFIRRMCP
jgi:hypothetical protein